MGRDKTVTPAPRAIPWRLNNPAWYRANQTGKDPWFMNIVFAVQLSEPSLPVPACQCLDSTARALVFGRGIPEYPYSSPRGFFCATNTLTTFHVLEQASSCLSHHSKNREERTEFLRLPLPSPHWMQKPRRDGVTNRAWCQTDRVDRLYPIL